jgi:LPS sulfotransferase NodH
MDIASESYHGSLIEEYFARKSGSFEPASRALPTAACGLFLCFSNRCGSTLVAAEASSLGFCGKPNSHLNYEFFNSDFVIEYCEQNSISTFQQYVEAIYEEFSSPLNIFFTKGSLDQLVWLKRSGVIGVALPNYHYLRVTRRDLVAQAVSIVIAHQTGQWTSMHGHSRGVPSYDHQKIAGAVSYFAKITADADVYFSLLDVQPAYFVYEEVLADIAQVGEKLQRLTGIDALPRMPRTLEVQKQTQRMNLEWAQRFRDEAIGVSKLDEEQR